MKLVLGLSILIAVSLFWAVTLWRAGQTEARAEAAFPPEGQFVDVAGHKVHAVVIGSGPDLVLIHGSSGNTRDMTFQLAPKLAERYRVFVFDRPGLGYSDPVSSDGSTITEQAATLVAAARELGAEKPLVAGHSYGGAVALAWAVHHPDDISGLIALSAASHPWDTGLTTYYKILSHPVLGRIVMPLIAAYATEEIVEREVAAVFQPDAVPEGYSAHFGPALTLRRDQTRANALQRRNLLEEIEALSPRYPEINVPVEILHGSADWAVGLQIHSIPLRDAVDGANLEILDGKGHMIQHTAPEAVIDAIDRTAARAGLSP
ncbi:MAG: alpha/beta hydrolase [Pseudomonadota bacterium]